MTNSYQKAVFGDRISAYLWYPSALGAIISAYLRYSSALGGSISASQPAWREKKTVPGAPETKKDQFEASFNLQIIVSGRLSKNRKSCPPNNPGPGDAEVMQIETASLYTFHLLATQIIKRDLVQWSGLS